MKKPENQYTDRQKQYIDSVGGEAHQSAIDIIGGLERLIKEQYVKKSNLPSVEETAEIIEQFLLRIHKVTKIKDVTQLAQILVKRIKEEV